MNRLISGLRTGDWLTRARAQVYGWMLLLFCVVLVLGSAVTILKPVLGGGKPLALDFNAFWAGATLAATGHAALAYDPASIKAAEAAGAHFAPGGWFIYLYPPIFQLFSLPLGLLPYLAALLAFLLSTYAAMAAGLRRILPEAWPWLAIAAFPAAAMNAMIGQNGFATAACFAGALVFLERRPILAGGLLGLLSAKPHLAICVPVGLLAARRWRALAGCAGVAAGAALLSWIALGGAAWRGFLAMAPAMRATLQSPDIWPKLASVYATVRLLHGGLALAYGLQAAVALGAATCVAIVCSRRPGGGAEVATMAAAGVLCTPYVWNYDLVVLAVPLAWAAGCASVTGWRPWEKTGLAAVFVLSAFVRLLNQEAGLPLAPLLLAALLALIAGRAADDGPAIAMRRARA